MSIKIENGYCEIDDKYFFKLQDISCMCIIAETHLRITVSLNHIELKYETIESTQEILKGIIGAIKDDILYKQDKYKDGVSRAQYALALQAKMNEKIGAL